MFHFETNSTDDLRALAAKKVGLIRLIQVARGIERLQKGLEAVVLTGKTSAGISKHVIRFYEQLSEHIRTAPTDRLRSDIEKLDRTIADNIGTILDIASRSTDSLEERPVAAPRKESQQDLIRMLDDFRRRAQTAVSLRVILKERGMSVPPLNLAALEQQIQANLERLNTQEQEYKARIESHILDMQADILLLLENPSHPPTIREELVSIQQGLETDLRHLRSGRPIDQLPFSVVKLGMDQAGDDIEPAAAAPEHTQQPRPDTRRTNVPTEYSGGFFARLWLWLKTPPDVTWAMLSRKGKGSAKNERR